MDGQVPALIFIQCLSALQLKEESPAPLTMAPPALLPVLLLSSFLFSPVPEDPLRVPAPGTAALGNLPKGLLLAFALPSSSFVGLGADPKQCLCATQGRQQYRVQGCVCSYCFPQPCPTDHGLEAAPKVVVNWSPACVDKP